MKKGRPLSIIIKLTVFMVIMIVVQTLLISALLINGGVIKQATDNAFVLFNDKVSGRLSVLEGEMKNNWTVFDPYLKNMSNLLTSDQDDTAFLEAAAKELIPLLRRSQVTGAYIILTDKGVESEYLPALYIRDYDPLMNSYSDDDLYVVFGPSNVATSYQIPLDQIWQYNFKVTEENRHFIEKTLSSDMLSAHTSDVGYWNKPFKLSAGDVEIITYSVPIFDRYGEVRGLVGIDITVNYLRDFLPKNELYPQDSLGYLIAYQDGMDGGIDPIVLNGALQKRLLNEDEPFEFTQRDEESHIFEVENHSGVESIYASVEAMGLYNYNSPYDRERWYLVGLMREEHLLKSTRVIEQIVVYSMVIALIFGVIGGIVISFQMSKPLIRLAKQLRSSDKNQPIELLSTGLSEIDALSEAFITTNKAMIESASRFDKMIQMSNLPIGAYEVNYALKTYFVTDRFFELLGLEEAAQPKDFMAFVTTLSKFFNYPIDEEYDVYESKSKVHRYIRYNQSANAEIWIGVILDVTDEIIEKRKIKRERDHDYLTDIFNRDGFTKAFERWYSQEMTGQSAIVMFDLDNLKNINDTYGHQWGDDYIKSAVAMLRTLEDEGHAIVGRRSGDEFYALLHNYDSKEAIIRVMDRLYAKIHGTDILFPDNQERHIAISSGLKWIDNKSSSFETLLHMADQALYEAKEKYKGFYRIYNG
ncbi:MAG: sensor domain-containing diguanylate cyclase [Clostridia bacterium]|nr:sensor domain-containing diguanylate cyclase [Clostridia bacterium]